MIATAYLYFVLLAMLAGVAVTQVLLAALTRNDEGISWPRFRTILVIAANCILANAFTLVTKLSDPWPFFILIDVLAATVILFQPAGKAQAVIGTLYLIQIAMHAGYGLAVQKGGADPVIYWWMLTVTGFLQLLICGGWWVNDRWGRHIRHIRRKHAMASAAHRSGVD